MQVSKNVRRVSLSAVGVLLAVVSSFAQAALDTAVTTELATAKTDMATLGGLVFAIAVVIALYKWFKRGL